MSLFTDEMEFELRNMIFEQQRQWEVANKRKLTRKAVNADLAIKALAQYCFQVLSREAQDQSVVGALASEMTK